MNLSQFDYFLPNRLIAQCPVYPRDCCKLMVLDRKSNSINHMLFTDIVKFLNKDDVIVFNDSKVIPARINFIHCGKKAEILLLKSLNKRDWIIIGKPGKVLKMGVILNFDGNLNAEIIRVENDGQRIIRFSKGETYVNKFINQTGIAPFPPYIKDCKASLSDYQTIYAKRNGSVAAPTAGLHFTEGLMLSLRKKGVKIVFVTLHVGLGTFLPVRSEDVVKHQMHYENYDISKVAASTLNKAKEEGVRIMAVGTTAVRVLEDSYDDGVGFKSGRGETNIYIYPGYKWKCVNGLITNFHLPKSTLLLLTSSFGGKELVARAYQEAIKYNYRFYSFGDAMLIL